MHIAAISASASASAVLDRAALERAFSIASEVAEKRSTVEVMSAVRVRAEGDGVALEGFNGDTLVSVTMPGAVDTRFDLCLSADRFGALLKKAPASSMVALSQPAEWPIGAEGVLQTDNAAADFESVRFAIRAHPGANFPQLDPVADGVSFMMKGEALRDGLAAVAGAISTEETRYYLNGVFMHVTHAGELVAVATDGHRLYRQTFGEVEGAAGMPGVIVPRNVVRILGKLLKGKACPAEIRVEVADARISFAFDDATGRVVIRSNVIDGTFPDYCRVIPTRNDNVATFDSAKMAEAVKAVSVIRDRPGAVKLVFGPSAALLEVVCPENGRAETEVALAGHDGEVIEIGLSASYLLEILAVAGKGEIALAMSDPGAPVRVTGSREGWDAVLMPMRV